MRKIGFIGLGVMGKPMAGNLIKAGYPLTVRDVRPDPVAEIAALGARPAGSAREAAEGADVVIAMLPNSPEVREAVFGRDGAAEGLRPGSVFIDMSSIAPLASREISARLAGQGVAMLDAPVSGGEPKAVDGTLAIMAGGPASTFEDVKDILSAMGKSVIHVGDIGSGNLAKLANQVIVALNIAAVSEAMTLAVKAGADPERIFQAIRGGLAGSAALEAKMPLILAGRFKPGFRIGLHIKDLLNVLETGHEVGAPLPLTGQVMEMMQVLKAEGKAGEDHGGLVQFYEKLAGVAVRSKA